MICTKCRGNAKHRVCCVFMHAIEEEHRGSFVNSLDLVCRECAVGLTDTVALYSSMLPGTLPSPLEILSMGQTCLEKFTFGISGHD